MTIGVDLSVVQTPHRMRGIGSTAINFMGNIPDNLRTDTRFVIFLYEDGQQEALDILDLTGINYEVRDITRPQKVALRLPGKFKKLNGILNGLSEISSAKFGDRRKADFSGLDAYLQFDQMQPLPRIRNTKKVVILYDLIPYIMEADYLWDYKTSRHYGDSRKSSIRKALLRHQYIAQVKAVCKNADKLIAISAHTKKDFIKYAGVDGSKIDVVHLGIKPSKKNMQGPVAISQYLENSWGYFKENVDLTDKPFILFVGGADPRRKLNALVGAYNNLRAQGHDIHLVFAGDTMKGASAIPVTETQKYLASSSYAKDIVYLGFVTDEEREWLYMNAAAFVYPSVYEGFGLPVLEAMQYGTPVITYRNSSIEEISGTAAIYADNSTDISEQVKTLLNDPKLRASYRKAGINQAAKFSWAETVKQIFSIIEK